MRSHPFVAMAFATQLLLMGAKASKQTPAKPAVPSDFVYADFTSRVDDLGQNWFGERVPRTVLGIRIRFPWFPYRGTNGMIWGPSYRFGVYCWDPELKMAILTAGGVVTTWVDTRTVVLEFYNSDTEHPLPVFIDGCAYGSLYIGLDNNVRINLKKVRPFPPEPPRRLQTTEPTPRPTATPSPTPTTIPTPLPDRTEEPIRIEEPPSA